MQSSYSTANFPCLPLPAPPPTRPLYLTATARILASAALSPPHRPYYRCPVLPPWPCLTPPSARPFPRRYYSHRHRRAPDARPDVASLPTLPPPTAPPRLRRRRHRQTANAVATATYAAALPAATALTSDAFALLTRFKPIAPLIHTDPTTFKPTPSLPLADALRGVENALKQAQQA